MSYKFNSLCLFSVALISCSQNTEVPVTRPMYLDVNVAPVSHTGWKPNASTTWQWQLQGTLDTTVSADVFDVDLEYTSTEDIQALQNNGHHVVCYFSAGSWEDFRSDAQGISDSALGHELDGWPEERWWDIRLTEVQNLILQRLDTAASKGCDGVEPDNADGYLNDNGLSLSAQDQLAFNRWLANSAHIRGLAVGLKNDLDQIADLVNYYDFAVNEQCHEYNECDVYTPFTSQDKPVFNAEYKSTYVNNTATRESLCTKTLQLNLRTLVLPLELDGSFRYSCDN